MKPKHIAAAIVATLTFLILFSLSGHSQVNWMNVYGKQRFVQGLAIPAGDTNSYHAANDTIALLMQRTDSNLYYRYKSAWRTLRTDTASLSNRINSKLNATDTASLSNRINLKLNATDTASLSNRINLKLNTTDTASLSNRINLKLNTADTASLSNRINLKLNATDTASLSNRINLKLNISDTSGMLFNKYLRVGDTSEMLSKYLRKSDTSTLSNKINLKLNISDTANKWVNRLERVPGKDSIIFYIGGTRYAIKDSVESGGGGTVTRAVDTIYRVPSRDSIIYTINGTRRAIKDSIARPSGIDGTIQFRSGNNFSGDSALYWDNTNKSLGIGTNSPQVPLDIAGGDGVRFLLYGTGGTPQYLAGLGVNLGQATNSMGFFTGANSPFSIDQANDFESFPYPSGYTTRFVVAPGGNVGIGTTSPGYKLHVSGDEYIEDKLVTNGARVKRITSILDDENPNYYVLSTDHVIIIDHNNNNVNVYLPEYPEDGRELIIKEWGDVGNFFTTLIAQGGHYILVGNNYLTSVDIKHDTEPNSVTLIYSINDGSWFVINGLVQ